MEMVNRGIVASCCGGVDDYACESDGLSVKIRIDFMVSPAVGKYLDCTTWARNVIDKSTVAWFFPPDGSFKVDVIEVCFGKTDGFDVVAVCGDGFIRQ